MIVYRLNEETVGNVLLLGSLSVGDGSIPHNPTVGEEPSPNPWNELQSVFDGYVVARLEMMGRAFLKSIWSNGEMLLHLIGRRQSLYGRTGQ